MPGHIYKTDLLPAYVWMKMPRKSSSRILVDIPIKNLTFIKVIRNNFQRLMCYQFEKGTMLFVRDLIYFHTGIAACFNKGLKHALHLSIYEHFHMKSRL